MILFDSLSIRDEPFQYSVELARRMEMPLIVLVILSLDSEEVAHARDFEQRAREALQGPMEAAVKGGVQTEAEVRVGDPSSELMKFLARSRSVHSIVWGGPPSAGDPRPDKGHWLNRMKDVLGCPVVIPSRRT